MYSPTMCTNWSFPERRFPSRFRMTALTLDDKRDDEESAFAERQITELPATRTLLFNLPNPFPGYRCELNWELPEDDGETLFNSVEKDSWKKWPSGCSRCGP
jgi:hypothetical protein